MAGVIDKKVPLLTLLAKYGRQCRVILAGDVWGAATGFKNLQGRFYSGPLWAYRSIGLVGVVGGIVIIVAALT